MPSRLPLSILGALFGSVVFYFLMYYGVIPLKKADGHIVTDVIVGIAGLMVAVGWWRIFSRRPAPAPTSQADSATMDEADLDSN